MSASGHIEPSLRLLASKGNWNLNPSKRDINLHLGAASGHLGQLCFRFAGTDNIANLEPPLPNIRFKTDCDGIFYTPVNHTIGSIDSARRPSVQLDDKAANRLPGPMLIEQYCSLLKNAWLNKNAGLNIVTLQLHRRSRLALLC
ncbi:MAG: hypothetical protein QOF56_1563 [Acidobacteriaceae bacterium]|nr:hypothetical protein [Acidobacteriaceae bacterium]